MDIDIGIYTYVYGTIKGPTVWLTFREKAAPSAFCAVCARGMGAGIYTCPHAPRLFHKLFPQLILGNHCWTSPLDIGIYTNVQEVARKEVMAYG